MGTMALATIMDLFTEGAVASAEGKDGRLIPVWVNKLSAFEKEDVDRLGRGARAKAILAWDRDEDEQAIFEYETQQYTDAELADALKAQVAGKHYFEAIQELRTQEDWTERLEYLANADLLEYRSPEASDEDKALFEKVTQEYTAAILVIQTRLQSEYVEGLIASGRDEMMKQYRDAWRDAQGMRAFYAERRLAELFFACRECKAKPTGKGEWDHAKCNHQVRLLSNRGQVRDLPDPFRDALVAVFEALDLSPEDAGNSDAPMASSGSSEPLSALEDSTPSSPTATPGSPAGT